MAARAKITNGEYKRESEAREKARKLNLKVGCFWVGGWLGLGLGHAQTVSSTKYSLKLVLSVYTFMSKLLKTNLNLFGYF